MEIPYPISPEPQALDVVTKPTAKATAKATTIVKPAKPEVQTSTTLGVTPGRQPKKKKTDTDADDAMVFLIVALVFIVIVVLGYLAIRRIR